MVFFSNAQGTNVQIVADPVNQGSANANEVIFAGPFATSNTVTVTYRTPGGISLTPRVLSLVDGAQIIDGVEYNAWTGLLDAAVTEFAGTVTAMFSITASEGTTIVTNPAYFEVHEGVYIEPPSDPSADVWGKILTAITTTNERVDNVILTNVSQSKAIAANKAAIEEIDGKVTAHSAQIKSLQDTKLDKQTGETENHMVYAKTPEGEQEMLPFPDGTIANLQDGEGSVSIQQVGNKAAGSHAAAFGNGSTAGAKGYYIKAVYYEESYVYITLSKTPVAQISNSLPDIDPSFETGWKAGMLYAISLKLLVGETYEPFHKYVNNIQISAIDHNRIRVRKSALPEGTVSYANYSGQISQGDNSVYCPNFPYLGSVELGEAAFAAGNGAQATANSAFAAGSGKTTADYAFAAGRGRATNDYAAATGGASASGRYSHATNFATAPGEKAHATNEARATGKGAHAENYSTCEASGDYAHAENNGKATAWQAHAENNGTANGVQSHAEGQNSVADGAGSHAEGGNCTASGELAHAEGSYCVANGRASHAQGIANSTTSNGQFAAGKWSKPGYDALGNEAADSTLIVRIGNGNAEASRSNAFTIDTSGTATMIAAMGSTAAISLPSHFITKEYADAHYGGVGTATYTTESVAVSIWFAGDDSVLVNSEESTPLFSQQDGFFYFKDYGGNNITTRSISYLLESSTINHFNFVLPPFSKYQRPDSQPADEIRYYNAMFPNYYAGGFTAQDGKYLFEGLLYYIKKKV